MKLFQWGTDPQSGCLTRNAKVTPWRYNIIRMRAQDSHPWKAELEGRWGMEYRGIDIGYFHMLAGAQNACEMDEDHRTDWRTPQECDGNA